MIYPIAEIFHSLQGEGHFTGTPMCFLRLAGCNVGVYQNGSFLPPALISEKDLPLFTGNREHSLCTTVTGQRFLCDTDYHRTAQHDEASLARMVYERHACVTGGEPFLHNLTPLVLSLQAKGIMVHIETSGTKPIAFPEDPDSDFPVTGEINLKLLWITISPKRGLLPHILEHANEIKLLVGNGFTGQDLEKFLSAVPASLMDSVYLQPINSIHEAEDLSLSMCLSFLEKNPRLKLSAQLHKYLHQR